MPPLDIEKLEEARVIKEQSSVKTWEQSQEEERRRPEAEETLKAEERVNKNEQGGDKKEEAGLKTYEEWEEKYYEMISYWPELQLQQRTDRLDVCLISYMLEN